jgi:hypothetical protein
MWTDLVQDARVAKSGTDFRGITLADNVWQREEVGNRVHSPGAGHNRQEE